MRVQTAAAVFALLAIFAATPATAQTAASKADTARVTVGKDKAAEFPARQVAALFVPYAILATRAYEPLLPDGACPATTTNDQNLPQHALDLLNAEWECIFSHTGKWKCPAGQQALKCSLVLSGLGVQIWRSKPKDGVCREFVIAFRGTDPKQVGDWLSNSRWITRILPVYDQYQQVRSHIDERVDWIKKQSCYRETSKIVATGHSLGGGLAQQAAYTNGSIRFVYAFDSTPVTGYHDVKKPVRRRNANGLQIDRIYESGEILAYLRGTLSEFYPVTSCHPQIRNVRFNYAKGNFVSQHSMAAFTRNLMGVAPGADATPSSSEFRLPNATCEEARAGG